ncbi:MAG: hypothetical protein AABM67_13995 [Acidobacteriota bacterium]
MSDSRRRFLKVGMLAAVFAAAPMKNVLAKGWNANADFALPDEEEDPLANYTKATFVSYLNSVFQMQTASGAVAITLLSVDDLEAPEGGECFSLLFRGGSTAWPQNTYTVEHSALGTFKLFLVPVGADSNGAQGYLATINRLP